MFWRVHRNKHWQREIFILVTESNAAFGREYLVIGVHVHNVFEASNGPIRTKLTFLTEMYRGFFSESFEIGPVRVLFKQVRLSDIKMPVKRDRIRVYNNFFSGVDGFAHIWIRVVGWALGRLVLEFRQVYDKTI